MMPFENSLAHAFTAGSIRAHAPTASGVYGISNAREWLYVGASDNVQGALLAHLQDTESPLARCRPAGFVFEVCWPGQQLERCDRLTREYSPVCNQYRPSGTHTFSRSKFGKERN